MNKKLVLSSALIAGLLVGTLDIAAACIHYYLKTHKNPVAVLEFIASGAFGNVAFNGDTFFVAAGFAFHYFIAIIFSLLFFLITAKFPVILQFKIPAGIAYGIFIWLVMNKIVLPFSQIPSTPTNTVNIVISMLILIVCIGIPLAFLAGKNNPPT